MSSIIYFLAVIEPGPIAEYEVLIYFRRVESGRLDIIPGLPGTFSANRADAFPYPRKFVRMFSWIGGVVLGTAIVFHSRRPAFYIYRGISRKSLTCSGFMALSFSCRPLTLTNNFTTRASRR